MRFVKDVCLIQKLKDDKKLVDAFEKSLNLSTIDSLGKLEKVCEQMRGFHEEHKDICWDERMAEEMEDTGYLQWGYSGETKIFATLRERILPLIPKDNHLSILKEVIEIAKKMSGKKIDRQELWFQLHNNYYGKYLQGFQNIDDKILRHFFDYMFSEMPIYDKMSIIFNGQYQHLQLEEEVLIKRFAKILKKEDIVYAVEHYYNNSLGVYKVINSDLVDEVLREVGVYDTNDEYLKPLYLKAPIKCIPYDLLKPETIEYVLTHMSDQVVGLYSDMRTTFLIFDFFLCDAHKLNIDRYIAGYCLKKANEGEYKLLDRLLGNIMKAVYLKGFFNTNLDAFYDLIEKIQDKEIKKKINDKYGIYIKFQ